MVTAVVLITASVDRIPELAQEIADLDGVTEVYSVTGEIDLVAMVRVRKQEQLAEVIAQGKDVVITPDGPRGPAYQLGQGIVFLAQQTGAAVVPVNLEYSSCWRLKSWDGFILPKPFSRVRVIFGQPHRVRLTTSESEFEEERVRLQEAMLQLVERR